MQVQVFVRVVIPSQLGTKHFIEVECLPSSTIGEIKVRVEQAGRACGSFDLPASRQDLQFLGSILSDQVCLSELGILDHPIKIRQVMVLQIA